MTRHSFGGGTADFVQEVDNQGVVHAGNGATCTFFTAQTGGTAIVDLTDLASNPITSVSADANGGVPPFMGPNDNTSAMWVSAGGSARQLMQATDIPARIIALEAGGGGGGGGTVTSVNGKSPVSGVVTLVPGDIGADPAGAAATAQANAEAASDPAGAATAAANTAQTAAIAASEPLLKVVGPKTANYVGSPQELATFDLTSGNLVFTLPTTPPNNTVCGAKILVQPGTNTLTIACGGSAVIDVVGGATSGTLKLLGQGKVLKYSSATSVWTVISDDLPLSQTDVRYLAPLALIQRGPWAPTTLYTAGTDIVIAPTGDIVTPKITFTSSASYSSANWYTIVPAAGFPGRELAALTLASTVTLSATGALSGLTDGTHDVNTAALDVSPTIGTRPILVEAKVAIFFGTTGAYGIRLYDKTAGTIIDQDDRAQATGFQIQGPARMAALLSPAAGVRQYGVKINGTAGTNNFIIDGADNDSQTWIRVTER